MPAGHVAAQEVRDRPAPMPFRLFVPAAVRPLRRELRAAATSGPDHSGDEATRASFGPAAPARSSVGRSVVQFVGAGLVALVLLAGGSALASRRAGTAESIRDATEKTALLVRAAIAPNLTAGVLRGDAAELARFDGAMESLVLQDPIVHLRMWTPEGRIAYADEPAMIGEVFPLRDDAQEALASWEAQAEVSNLSAPENRFEQADDTLLEVYYPIAGPLGRPLLVETYHRYGPVTESARRIWLSFAPAALGSLLLLQLVQVPLATRLARRVEHARREREELLRSSLEASTIERRRIAHDLHDGAVQDLVGVGFTLSALADRAERVGDTDAERSLRGALGDTRGAVRSLRSLFVEIYPPNLERAGLVAALGDLLASLAGRGIVTELRAPDTLRVPLGASTVAYRVAQEAVRNVVKHARAQTVTVTVGLDERVAPGVLVVRIVDDGVGLPPGEDGFALPAAAPGHFGLRMADDLVRSAGGTLRVAPGRSGGTEVEAEVPLR